MLGLFDDDVAIRPDWKANASEEEKINKIRMAYTWAKNMKDEFSGYNTYGEVYKKILGCNSVLDYIDEVQGSEEERNRVMAQALAFRGLERHIASHRLQQGERLIIVIINRHHGTSPDRFQFWEMKLFNIGIKFKISANFFQIGE